MLNKTKLTAAIALTTVLTACGGGGGTDNSSMPTTVNPLLKYAGNYSSCNDHQKTTATISITGTNQASFMSRIDIFEVKNCTGANVGTRTYSLPITFTYKDTGVSIVSSVGLIRQNLTIDRVNAFNPVRIATMTGSGVSGPCVGWDTSSESGEVCYDYGALPITESTTGGGLYLNGNLLYILRLINGGEYQSDGSPIADPYPLTKIS